MNDVDRINVGGHGFRHRSGLIESFSEKVKEKDNDPCQKKGLPE